MQTFFFILELIGTVAFSISGAMTAIRKQMDVFGVVFLGTVTAVGGGALRDLMIGVTPPSCFQNPRFLVVAIVTAFLFFLPFVRQPALRHYKTFDALLFLSDSVGLGVFAVSGVQAALAVSGQFSIVLLLFVGMLTGTGGGILRDILAGDTPYIFIKHVYAMAAVAGAVLYLILLELQVSMFVAYPLSAAVVVVMRVLAARFKWNLPRAKGDEENAG